MYSCFLHLILKSDGTLKYHITVIQNINELINQEYEKNCRGNEKIKEIDQYSFYWRKEGWSNEKKSYRDFKLY